MEQVRTGRVESIDVLRGVIMILMALDHTRDFFGSLAVSPTNLATTTVPLFFTRWTTHFCAPVFFLLTGTGAFLALRQRSRDELSRFLLTRGLWLIFLELVVVRCLGWQFNFDYEVTMLTVLWALGWSMIVLSALVWLPIKMVGAFGVVMILTHNLLDGVPATALGSFAPLWTILHAPGFAVSGDHAVFVAYPLIPWIGVSAVGYTLGSIYHWDTERRRRWLLWAGVAVTLAFLALRTVNLYGDPVQWAAQRSPAFTFLSFLNTNKYPPSLLFLLMTLGPALLFLRAVEQRVPAFLRPALIIGKVPLFYYVLHVVLLHTTAVFASYVRYGEIHWMFESPSIDRFPITQPPGWPASLPVVYAIWIGVVVALYPLCRWFASVKARRHEAWLSYL